jgi:hypothetical protein
MARVTFEAFEYVVRRRPAVGIALKANMSAEIEAARHAIKLVDDSTRSVDDVLSTFREIEELHAQRFPLGKDVALSLWKGAPVYTSRSAEYQEIASIRAQRPYDTSFEMGRSLGAILQSGLGVAIPSWTKLQLPTGELKQVDARSTVFYSEVYSPSLTTAEKDLLLTLEANINAASLFREFAGDMFVGPVFRTQLLAFVHAVTALESVALRHSDDSCTVPSTVSGVLADDDSSWLLGQRALRNRAMHYGIPPTLNGVSNAAPMYGIVEATTGRTYAEVNDKLLSAASRLTERLGEWRRNSH